MLDVGGIGWIVLLGLDDVPVVAGIACWLHVGILVCFAIGVERFQIVCNMALRCLYFDTDFFNQQVCQCPSISVVTFILLVRHCRNISFDS